LLQTAKGSAATRIALAVWEAGRQNGRSDETTSWKLEDLQFDLLVIVKADDVDIV
jgi:hypothetical protein